MKNVKVKDYRLSVIILLAMMPIMMSAVEYKNMYQPVEGRMQPAAQLQTTVPSVNFQSTSTLTGSGSALSATPMLNADGTANTPAPTMSRPRRIDANGDGFDDETGLPVENIDNPNPSGQDNTPLGDAVLPLLLLALAYLSTRVPLKSRALKS